MAHVIKLHFHPDGDPCDSSPQGVLLPESERGPFDFSGEIAARLEMDCASKANSVRIEYSLDGSTGWTTLMQESPPVVDSCARTKITEIPQAAKHPIWLRAFMVGAQSSVCRLIVLETLDIS
jgi:hypothetical protein